MFRVIGKLIKFLVILFILGSLSIGIYVSVFKLNKGQVLVVNDRKNKNAAAIYNGSYNFVWQGSLFWRYDIKIYSLTRDFSGQVAVYLPEFVLLKKEYYAVIIPYSITSSIDLSKININLIGNSRALERIVSRTVKNVYLKRIQEFLYPQFNPFMVIKRIEDIENIEKSIKDTLLRNGLEASGISLQKRLRVPSLADYNNGKRLLERKRRLDDNQILAKQRLVNEILGSRKKTEEYFSQLVRISRIIKDNPDILKYIYIDKLGANVKVILSSDASGYPLKLNKQKAKQPKKNKGEIDNLR